MSALVHYEHMRIAVERCARIDEAAELRDKAAALAAYARQRDDRDLDVWMSEIKLRATVRIGELVRDLDSTQGARNELPDADVGKSKAEAIADAGLNERTAQRYQELAGPRDEQAQAAGRAAAENYFAKARAEKNPATIEGLRGAVKDAVHATLGPRPTRPATGSVPVENKITNDWLDFTSAVRTLADNDADLDNYAARSPVLKRKLLDEALLAAPRIRAWIGALEKADEAERPAA